MLRDSGLHAWAVLGTANLFIPVSMVLAILVAKGRRIPAALWLVGPALTACVGIAGTAYRLDTMASWLAGASGQPSPVQASVTGGLMVALFPAILATQLAAVGAISAAWMCTGASLVRSGELWAKRDAAQVAALTIAGSTALAVAEMPFAALCVALGGATIAATAATTSSQREDAGRLAASRTCVAALASAAVACATWSHVLSLRVLYVSASQRSVTPWGQELLRRAAYEPVESAVPGALAVAALCAAGLGAAWPMARHLWTPVARRGLVACCVLLALPVAGAVVSERLFHRAHAAARTPDAAEIELLVARHVTPPRVSSTHARLPTRVSIVFSGDPLPEGASDIALAFDRHLTLGAARPLLQAAADAGYERVFLLGYYGGLAGVELQLRTPASGAAIIEGDPWSALPSITHDGRTAYDVERWEIYPFLEEARTRHPDLDTIELRLADHWTMADLVALVDTARDGPRIDGKIQILVPNVVLRP